MTCNWARGKRRGCSPGAAARHKGRTRAPADDASEVSFSIFPLESGRLRRAISNQTSPPDVQLQIARLLPADVQQTCNNTCNNLFTRPIPNWTSPKMRCDLKSDVEVNCQMRRRPISKKSGGNKGKKGSLKCVGPVVRQPLWRAAGSEANAPPLAARPCILWVFATL